MKRLILLASCLATPAFAGDAETLCATNPAYTRQVMLEIVQAQIQRDHDPALDADTPEHLADQAVAQGIAECAADLRADPATAAALGNLDKEDRSVAWDAYNTTCTDHKASRRRLRHCRDRRRHSPETPHDLRRRSDRRQDRGSGVPADPPAGPADVGLARMRGHGAGFAPHGRPGTAMQACRQLACCEDRCGCGCCFGWVPSEVIPMGFWTDALQGKARQGLLFREKEAKSFCERCRGQLKHPHFNNAHPMGDNSSEASSPFLNKRTKELLTPLSRAC